jgi:hypothetical protein
LLKSLQDFKIQDIWKNSLVSDRRFLLYDSENSLGENERITIFASDDQIKFLSTCKRWGYDGTFDSAPRFFNQLYIIFGIDHDVCVPVCYALLTGKDVLTYTCVLEQLVLKARELSLELDPDVIMIDFEKAAFKSFNKVFPRAEKIGCYFHFSKCLWRNFELKKHYDGDLKVWFKRVLALAFLPHDEIRDMFVELMDEAPRVA